MHHGRNGFLTAKGLKEAAKRERQFSLGVDMDAGLCYLDNEGSVSGLRRDEDMYALVSDTKIDEQARRFHNGS